MTIQLINLGAAPDGAGGDTNRSANKKINNNFSDANNAASRLVGTNDGDVMEVGAFGLGSEKSMNLSSDDGNDLHLIQNSFFCNTGNSSPAINSPSTQGRYAGIKSASPHAGFILVYGTGGNLVFKGQGFDRSWDDDYRTILESSNTTVDANGFIKQASPIVKLHNDKIECNDLAAQQDIEFERIGTGDYLLKNTSGLADEGWYIELPLDANGNPKVAVVIDDKDNDISIKTYKRIFDMSTFLFGPDLDTPLDIPDGRWIDVRLNDVETDEIVDVIE